MCDSCNPQAGEGAYTMAKSAPIRMSLTSFEFVPARHWAQRVDTGAGLSRPDTLLVARPAFREPVPPPDFVASPADVAGIGDGRRFGFSVEDGTVAVDDAFLARFDGIRLHKLARLPVPANPYTVLLDDRLALAETYGNRFANEHLCRSLGEAVRLDAAGAACLVKLRDDPPVDQQVTGPCLLLASRFTHANYFHWMVDALSRLWALELFGDPAAVPLLLPQARLTPYQQESLDRLVPANPRIGLNCHMARIGSLFFPSFYAPGGYSAAQMAFLSGRLRAAFAPAPGEPPGPRRLYVSRRDVAYRRVVNEDAVLAMLRPHGFEAVVLSGLSLAEQARLFARAEIVVAPHGAGNTNMLFAPPGAALIEVVPAAEPQICYWMLTKLNRQRYGRLLDDGTSGHGLRFDLERLSALIGQALAATP